MTADQDSSVGLSIVIPVFNAESTIGTLVEELSRISVTGGMEIVLVDDGSADASAKVCEELVELSTVPVHFVRLSRNFGEHNAIMAGLAHTSGNYVITMDDDFQNPPEEVARLYEYARQSDYDVIYTYYNEKRHAWWRNLGSWLTNALAHLMLDKPRGLYLSSFRCINAFTARNIAAYDGPFPYIDGIVLQVTQSLGRIKVDHHNRLEGKSNYTLRRLIRLWLSMFLNFSVMPLRLGTALGLVMAFVGLLTLINVFVQSLFFGAPLGWGSLMATIVVFSGVQLLTLGVAAEYLGRLHLTVNKRPQYIVRTLKTAKHHPPSYEAQPE